MSKGVVLLLIALAAGLGIYVGRWSAHRDESWVDVEPASDTTPSAAPGAPAPRAASELAAKGDAVADAFRAALAKLPAPEVPQGTGSISGTVLTASGEPLAG